MSCAITSGYSLDCRDSVGGIKVLYINGLENVTAYTSASGTVSVITKSSVFYKYELEEETSNAESVGTGNRQNGTFFYAQKVVAMFLKQGYVTADLLRTLAKKRLVIVVVDNNGKNWIYGKDRGLMVSNSTASTGTAKGDMNGYNVTFDGNEPDDVYEYTGSLSALTT